MGILLVLLGLAIWLAIIAGAAACVIYAFRSEDPLFPAGILKVATPIILAFVIIVPLSIITGEITFKGVPDGCYRIVTNTQVGTSSDGKVIVISGRTYTPIACP